MDDIVLAFDVGGTSIKAAAFDAKLTRLAETSRRSPRGEAVLDAIVDAATELSVGRTPVAAGVAMLGLVDQPSGRVIRSVNLGLDDLDVAGPLSRRLGVPVRVGHDVQAAGDAEWHAGLSEVEDPYLVVIGTGIAGVGFVRGRAIAGVAGQAGEIGHLVVRPGGALCGCGARGCLEAEASASAISRAYAALTGTAVAGALDVLARRATDPVAEQVWDAACSALADGLLAVCAVLAPGALVLGGGLSEAGDALLEPVRKHLQSRAGVLPVPPLRRATLGSSAGLVGAAHLALEALA